MNRIKRLLTDYGAFLILTVILVSLWEWAARTGKVPSFIIPAPSKVIEMLIEQKQALLWVHTPATLKEALIGFAFALISGIAIALAMHLSKLVEKMLYPFVLFSQTIPIIALSPIFVLWFGYDIWSKIAVTVLVSFFPIVVSCYDGFKNIDQDYVDLLRSMGASRWKIFIKVEVPFSMPSLFSGIKLAIIYSIVGATIGEWLGASEGLGYYSRRMSGNLNAEGVFAAVLLLTILGMVLFSIAALIEKGFLKWSKK
jgi:putative hydroxymethylpyrimidine transport system permease protein